jgi:hypothetical protein
MNIVQRFGGTIQTRWPGTGVRAGNMAYSARGNRYTAEDEPIEFLNVHPTDLWRRAATIRRGKFRVSGILYRDGLPFTGTVYLLERRTLRILETTTSGPDGTYLFDAIPGRVPYLVLAFDGPRHSRPDLNATIIDWVTAEPMP